MIDLTDITCSHLANNHFLHVSIAVLRLFARDHLEAGVSGEDLKPGQKYEV